MTVMMGRTSIPGAARAGAVALLMSLAASCATASSVTPTGKVVQVTQADAGKTISLHQGDTLRILLGPPLGGNLFHWQLRRYPKDLLDLSSSDENRGRFDFVATTEGEGEISLVGLVRCQPGPVVGAPQSAGVQCPVLGGASGSEATPTSSASPASRLVPARLLSFSIEVSA